MDPSEFEDTVEKSSEILSAGALELLFDDRPQFQSVDLKKESDEIYQYIYSLQESLKKFQEISISKLSVEMEEESEKLSALKDDYLKRRKVLTIKVKKFTTNYLENSGGNSVGNSVGNSDNNTSNSVGKSVDNSVDDSIDNNNNTCNSVSNSYSVDTKLLLADCKDLVNTFKKEFDNLSSLSRYSETLFLSVYKTIGGVPDPTVIVQEALEICLKSQDCIKIAQEQLTIADKLLNNNDNSINNNSNNHNSNSSSTKDLENSDISSQNNSNSHCKNHNNSNSNSNSYNNNRNKSNKDYDKLIIKHEKEKEEIRNAHVSELLQQQNNYYNEIRKSENNLKNYYELQQLEIIKNYDELLVKKESEINLLLQTIADNQSKTNEFHMKNTILLNEQNKKRELDEKLHHVLIELSDCKNNYNEIVLANSNLSKKLLVYESNYNVLDNEKQKEVEKLQTIINNLNEKVILLDNELASRPPVDLSGLMEKIGMTSDEDFSIDRTNSYDYSYDYSNSNNVDNNTTTKKIKINSWQKVESYIIETVRKSNSEATNSRVKEHESTQLVKKLQTDYDQCLETLSKKSHLVETLESELLESQKALESTASLLKAYQMNTPKKSMKNYNSSLSNTIDDDNLELLTINKQLSSRNNNSGHTTNSSIRQVDEETAIISATQGLPELNPSDRFVQAVQNQRDRYMKDFHEKEKENSSLLIKIDKLQEESTNLRNENLELYRRLRNLRVNVNSEEYDSDRLSYDYSRNNNVRVRKAIANEIYDLENDMDDGIRNQTHDVIENKYSNLYEQQISPFHVTEYDKKVVYSKLNIFEKVLAYVTKNMLSDRYARHALMVYLLLIHLLALFYVIKVLNPQLADEVDLHLKEKWSKETMNAPEHLDA